MPALLKSLSILNNALNSGLPVLVLTALPRAPSLQTKDYNPSFKVPLIQRTQLCIQILLWAGEMARWVKVLATISGDLNLIPGTYIMERR